MCDQAHPATLSPAKPLGYCKRFLRALAIFSFSARFPLGFSWGLGSLRLSLVGQALSLTEPDFRENQDRLADTAGNPASGCSFLGGHRLRVGHPIGTPLAQESRHYGGDTLRQFRQGRQKWMVQVRFRRVGRDREVERRRHIPGHASPPRGQVGNWHPEPRLKQSQL